MGSHSLLQWIFQTEGLNLCLLHCRQILYHLSHQPSVHTWSFFPPTVNLLFCFVFFVSVCQNVSHYGWFLCYNKIRRKSLCSFHLVIFIFTIHKLMTRSGEEVYGLTSLNGHNVWRYMYLTWKLIKKQPHQRRTLITRETKWPNLWTSVILFSLEFLC